MTAIKNEIGELLKRHSISVTDLSTTLKSHILELTDNDPYNWLYCEMDGIGTEPETTKSIDGLVDTLEGMDEQTLRTLLISINN